jgi:hypothetical protein
MVPPPQLIETTTIVAYCSRTVVACYTDRNGRSGSYADRPKHCCSRGCFSRQPRRLTSSPSSYVGGSAQRAARAGSTPIGRKSRVTIQRSRAPKSRSPSLACLSFRGVLGQERESHLVDRVQQGQARAARPLLEGQSEECAQCCWRSVYTPPLPLQPRSTSRRAQSRSGALQSGTPVPSRQARLGGANIRLSAASQACRRVVERGLTRQWS